MLFPPPKKRTYSFYPTDRTHLSFSRDTLLEDLQWMLLIRQFETRGEAAYTQGLVGGFFHSYIGQEAIQVALLRVFGRNHWYTTTYRCHALALLLGATPNELMAELYGKATGNAKGRGGSMHMYTDNLLGGFAVVGGQIPVATGAAFSIKYQQQQGRLSVCFLGDGALAQGAFHESLNLSVLMELPCVYVIENNLWGMGTAVERAISFEKLAEDVARLYGIKGYTLDGTDYFHLVEAFQAIYREALSSGRPILVEAVAERLKGHSISDPGHYRTRDALEGAMTKDPLLILKQGLLSEGILTEEGYKELTATQRAIVVEAMHYAENSPWPDSAELTQGVYAD